MIRTTFALALALVAACKSQTVGELLTPDVFSLSGTTGDADVSGEFGRCNVPYSSDADFYAVTATLGFNLTENERDATRETTRMLAEIRDLLARPPAPAPSPAPAPAPCEDPAPWPAAKCESAVKVPRAAVPVAAVEPFFDLADALYASAVAAAAIAGYANRRRIPGVRRLRWKPPSKK